MTYDQALSKYEKLIELHPSIERKGKTMPYTSINGHMTSFLSKEGQMGLRLSAADLATFIDEHQANLMEQHGRVMKEYVEVPEGLLDQVEELSLYFQKSIDYVSSLKPKASKKK